MILKAGPLNFHIVGSRDVAAQLSVAVYRQVAFNLDIVDRKVTCSMGP